MKKNQNKEEYRSTNNNIIGSQHFLDMIEDMTAKIKQSTSTVLILGETGTGKSMLAKHLYENACLYKNNFRTIALNEIPETLFESELFGYQRGSFTGASNNFEGKIKSADGGTIVLEDIACLPLHLQAKLLRLLQDKEFERIGESETISVALRIFATTNEPLEVLIKTGAFRPDLFYRLNVIEISLEPLRKRKDDIEPLAAYFLRKYSSEQNKNIKCIGMDTLKVLQDYSWPGNIRQLQSEIERAVSLADNSKLVLEPSDFSSRILYHSNEEDLSPVSLANTRKISEKESIIEALIQNNGHKGNTAKELKISRRTLYNKLYELGIKY